MTEIVCIQYFVQLYIEDTKNTYELRKYGTKVHEWLESKDIKTENMVEKSYEYSVFVLETMEKYWKCATHTFHSNVMMVAEDVLSSLKFQITKYRERERQMANILCVVGYRGYD